MDIETFRDYCLSLHGTTEGMKWELLCFMVEEKIFVITSLNDGTLCFKCDPNDFDAFIARHGISQAPHFARRHWVAINSLEVMPDKELKQCIASSRSLVLKKLSKKIQAKYEN
ncbi:MmcQ/YjbR family DNA-binding protein [Pedobacter sp. JCM 36344]|uniref:MmcQ/YjbR family DNA-binding protein n=1 Tax=Pedobacter sp. JCM 36344 TaxID=3374280 RepID=UPI00397D12A2